MRGSSIVGRCRIFFIVIAGIIGLSVNAQETIEEVVVQAKSIKASQLAAIEAKRIADNVADVISADGIGRFPDQNLADALGRLPGLAIERDQGQARYIAFRGAPKRYTTTAFDGIDIPGVENGRIPRFDSYPAVITSQVVANKAITADMPGESISGYINVKTFKPSDIDGWSFSVEYGMGEQDLGDGDVEKQNTRVSYSNDQFGFLLFGSENSREQITDNREMEYGVTADGALTPDEIQFRNYLVEREDEAFGGTFEYYLNDGGRIFLTSLNTKFTDREERNEWRFYMDGPPLRGTVDSANVRRLWEDGDYVNETDVNTLGAEFTFRDWDVTVSYSDIETLFDTWLPIPYFIGGGQVSNVSYDLSDSDEPILTFDENLADVEYGLPLFADAIALLETETDQFKIDLSRPNQWGELKMGFKYDDRSAVGGGAPLTILVFPYDLGVDVTQFDQGPWETDFNNTVGAFYSDNRGLRSALEAAGMTRSDFPDDEKVTIDETLLAAYVMQTIDRDWGSIVLGVRVEDTDYETVGSRLEGTVSVPLSVDQSYTNVLPSAHVNWDLSDDKRVRFSFSTGISRPTYIEARAAATIDPIGSSIVGGNPELEEETSWGVDLAYEWYFDEASIFSATFFHRSIDNVIAESNEKVLGSIYSDLAEPGELWDLSGFGNGKDGEIQGIELAFTARLDNYIEGFWSGFGIEANATFIDSEYTTPGGIDFDLPGTSDEAYNFSIFYENYGLSARVSYRYRDAWLDETETSSAFGLSDGVYWDDQERVDLSVRYDLEALTGYKASIFLDMNNLTDETDVRYTGKRWNPNQVEAYGRRYLLGFRFSM
ncbi:MAG TPA: hypothetical protein DEQ32_14555 [Gammaproteobacteria bacterium]|nr:hypothetical protein [Gammaproteobacteria bacterium]